MLAQVPAETKMLIQHYTLTILLDLGEAQRNLGCYRKNDKTLSPIPQQNLPPAGPFGGLDNFQLKPKNNDYAKASMI